jgi:molybdopterin/thiamine biosynthesis adenylyltransferase
MNRFDRNERFFGIDGQRRLRNSSVAFVGAGGLGTHVIQQTAHLGLGRLVIIDPDMQDNSNKNRNVGSYAADGQIAKVDVAKRLVNMIDPEIVVETFQNSLFSEGVLHRLQEVDYVFGCLDNDGARLVLTEHCTAYDRIYFDLASDIHVDENIYGGRVFVTMGGSGCLFCQGELDPIAAREDLETLDARKDRRDIYGISIDSLAQPGPSVVSINAVVASLAVTEFMLHATGIRPAHRLLEYRADQGIVKRKSFTPNPDCYYCGEVYRLGERAGTHRYGLLNPAAQPVAPA